jgi:hypothetical protein
MYSRVDSPPSGRRTRSFSRFCSTNPIFRPTGTTWSPTCRSRPCRRWRRTAIRSRPSRCWPSSPARCSSRKCPASAGSDSRRSAPDLQAVAADADVPRPPPRADARHAGEDLLQVRGRQPGRLAQGQHLGAAGLLQQDGRHHPPDHRNRRRPVGLLDLLRRPDVRHRGARLHGEGELQPEALPPLDDADLGRGSLRLADRHDQCRPRRAGGGPEQPRLARPGHLRGGRGSGLAQGHQLQPGLGAEPRLPAPDGDRPGSQEAVREGRRLSRHGVRLLRRRLQLRRHGLPLPRRQGGRQEGAPGGGRAELLSEPDQGRLCLRLRRRLRLHAADEDVHPRPRLHAALDPCRRPALSRRFAAGVPALQRGPDRGGGRAADRHLRGRRAVRPRRGHHSGAGVLPRHPRLHRRGAALQADRREEDAVLQPVGPRPLRHGVLRQVLRRRTGGLRLSGRSRAGGPQAPAEAPGPWRFFVSGPASTRKPT